MSDKKLEPVQMFCPNCGKLVIGYKSEDGAVRISCHRCKVVLYSKQRSKREINIKMIAEPITT
jgi:ribosomal protein S27AE